VLFVEDEAALREAVASRLCDEGFQIVECDNGEDALARLQDFAFDAVITDLRLPGLDGAALLEASLERYPDLIVIVVTGYGTVKDAVQAIRRGAADFITKPFQFDELLHVLRAGLERRRLRTENAVLRSQLEARYSLSGLVGHSRPMRELAQLLETVAPTHSTILITGETGTGKELVARAIHQNSARAHQRFVAFNVSAVPETLAEAELFGHVRGAFTGAVATRQGRFELAHRGTLLLDEVGTMSPALQMKLLRVLQEREVERVGDRQPIKVDVRVLAATNADLRKLVDAGTFREDLYYRLNVIEVRLPPLRERREDIPLLAAHFLERFGRDYDPPRTGVVLSQEVMRRLMAFSWPGNVRQLENTLERALALTPPGAAIDVAALPPDLRDVTPPGGADLAAPPVAFPRQGLDLETFLATTERALIRQALTETGGNRRRAAERLGVKRTTLVEKIKRLGPFDLAPDDAT
jgi:two-component system response regulator PilR (NtrC family)